jgi:predicted HTH transcriptional regulator
VLYYHKLFESWGRGVRLIIDGCVEAGHPPPVYSINSGGLLLTMPSKALSPTISLKASAALGLTERQQEILSLFEQTSGLSTNEIHERLSSPPTDRWLRNELNRLKEKGYIDSAGNTTAKKWFIKK